MSDAAFVQDAKMHASLLVRIESRGPGDTDNAMRRLEQKYGIPYWTLWALRYRLPKIIAPEAFCRIKAAYQAECRRQARHFAHEQMITEAKNAVSAALTWTASALVGETSEQDSSAAQKILNEGNGG